MIFGDCFSGGAFSAVDENHLILFSKNDMQLFYFFKLRSTGSFILFWPEPTIKNPLEAAIFKF
jgi:hypothetical protein